jgi:predicted  nucleic acid-binding Zn-ribbon protein
MATIEEAIDKLETARQLTALVGATKEARKDIRQLEEQLSPIPVRDPDAELDDDEQGAYNRVCELLEK